MTDPTQPPKPPPEPPVPPPAVPPRPRSATAATVEALHRRRTRIHLRQAAGAAVKKRKRAQKVEFSDETLSFAERAFTRYVLGKMAIASGSVDKQLSPDEAFEALTVHPRMKAEIARVMMARERARKRAK